ncbi:aminotransferase class IV [Micromonospora echinofusca]|uniref:aminotransferase class IV n=1 Tax=Micromonospora echinofusca TaxID=47858 RepID=UPI0034143505
MAEPAVWFDGRIHTGVTAEPTLSTFGLHYGYSVFEGLRSFDVGGTASIFALQPHIDRLLGSAATLDIPIRYDNDTLVAAHYEVLAANGLTEAYIRPIAFFGDGLAGLGTQRHQAHLAILAWPWANPAPGGGGVRLAIARRRRPSPESLPPHAKAAGSYLIAKLAHNEATARGFTDAIMLDDRDHVAEATSMNVFLVRDGGLLTPTTRACLPGITRRTVIDLARQAGIGVREADLTVSDVLGADEVFLTSTAAGVRPVLAVEDHVFGDGRPGALTTRLLGHYDEHVLTHSTPSAAFADPAPRGTSGPAAVLIPGGRA